MDRVRVLPVRSVGGRIQGWAIIYKRWVASTAIERKRLTRRTGTPNCYWKPPLMAPPATSCKGKAMPTRIDREPSIMVSFVSEDDNLTIPTWAERTDLPALPEVGERVVLGTSGPTVRVFNRTFMAGTLPRVLLFVRPVDVT